MGSPQEAVSIVLAVQEAWRFFMFSSQHDERTCEHCLTLDMLAMTRREIEARFPYLEKVNDLLWLPHVHPNCRCELRFEEEEEEEDVRVDKRWKK